MRIAALYDIHGNLSALEAVLDEVRAAGVDEVIVGGDVVPGPFPRETLASLLALEIPVQFIRGNGEREVVAAAEGRPSAALPPSVQEVIQWTVEQLTSEELRVLATWPLTLTREIPRGGKLLFCHATPRDDNEIFTETTPGDVLVPLFESEGADIVLCGHTHMQFDRTVGSTRVVNAGSVGMPFGSTGAYWVILGDEVELRRTALPLEAVADGIASSSYPGAQRFAEESILNPPSKETMLEIFERAALR